MNHTPQLTDIHERPIHVVEQPLVIGPFEVEGDPSVVAYEIVARLSLPASDTEVTPSASYTESAQHGKCVDVRWLTSDDGEPCGIWERSALITLPRQFGVGAYTVTGEAPHLERECGA